MWNGRDLVHESDREAVDCLSDSVEASSDNREGRTDDSGILSSVFVR